MIDSLTSQGFTTADYDVQSKMIESLAGMIQRANAKALKIIDLEDKYDLGNRVDFEKYSNEMKEIVLKSLGE